MAKKKRAPVRRKLVAVGGGPYVLDAAGRLFRVDAGQDIQDGPEGVETVTHYALLTPLEIRYTGDA